MRNPKYHLYMDYGEYREIIDALTADDQAQKLAALE